MKSITKCFTNITILLLFQISQVCYSQKIATLSIELPRAGIGTDIPVNVNLDDVTYIADSLLVLYEVKDGNRIEVPFQIESCGQRILVWSLPVGDRNDLKYSYELWIGRNNLKTKIEATANKGLLTIHTANENLLQYCFKMVYPPAGIDTTYKRSGFIHPLWAPHGQVLTCIQPPDHYHHYGIWNPWTKVEYEGDTIDFWNLYARQGTVRFSKFISTISGPVFAGFDALHEHVVFKKSDNEKVAMNELHSVRVYPPVKGQDSYIVDFYFRLSCADENPVKLLEYRYSGLGWRATEKWNNKNSMVLTSEGRTRKDADGSKARWCIVQGEIDNDFAGIEMMSFPTNYNFPEPLRIWPEDQNVRGDLFANFCPTKDTDWLLVPGKTYLLKYRFLVFNGHLDKEKADIIWYYFANPPSVIIKKTDSAKFDK